MRFALIGHTGHWTTYRPVLAAIPDATLVAVAPGTDEETPGGFDPAPGLSAATKRYDRPEALLDSEQLDFVQVCCRSDRTPRIALECLNRGIPVVAEKPLAMDLQMLAALWDASQRVPIVPMHTQRSEAWVAAAKRAVASGALGKPMLSFHQKSYKWGARRPDWFRSRKTFAGIAPYIGIHALDWLVWILGGDWDEIAGWESTAARPDYPACASQAGYVLRGRDGQVATLSLDYLRPPGAPSHGDERLRIAGTAGLLEMAPRVGINSLIQGEQAPVALPTPEPENWYVSFVRSLRGESSCVIPRWDAFRATEIALVAQRAAETGEPRSLNDTAYRPS